MASDPEISSFIRATFRSIWALELLLFLRKNGDRSWSHAEMVASLRGSDLVVVQSIEGLSAAGLVLAEEGGAARYRPVSEDLDRLVAGAGEMYARSPDAVRRMIVASAHGGLAAFADAFRLRKD
jgi:hypothetical protein